MLICGETAYAHCNGLEPRSLAGRLFELLRLKSKLVLNLILLVNFNEVAKSIEFLNKSDPGINPRFVIFEYEIRYVAASVLFEIEKPLVVVIPV